MEQIYRKCGHPLEDGAKFCGSCGEPIFSREETALKQGTPSGNQGVMWDSKSCQPERWWKQPVQYGRQDRGDNTKAAALVVGCAAALIVGFIIIFLFKEFVGGKVQRKFPAKRSTEAISENGGIEEGDGQWYTAKCEIRQSKMVWDAEMENGMVTIIFEKKF